MIENYENKRTPTYREGHLMRDGMFVPKDEHPEWTGNCPKCGNTSLHVQTIKGESGRLDLGSNCAQCGQPFRLPETQTK